MHSLFILLSGALVGGDVSPGIVDFPACTFTQGGDRAPDEPRREVTLSAYRLDVAEVSIARFEAFVREGWDDDAHWSPAGLAWRKDHPHGAGPILRASERPPDHPVVAVTWFEAEAFCHAQGGRLPTEAEWEHAACAGDKARFPWGEATPAVPGEGEPAADDPNEKLWALPEGPVWFTEGKWGHLPGVATRPVTSLNPAFFSPRGLVHMAGNVWEWTADSYHKDSYRAGPVKDPLSVADTPWKVLRGGSFMNLPSYCTCTHREPARPSQVRLSVGFRCAYPAP